MAHAIQFVDDTGHKTTLTFANYASASAVWHALSPTSGLRSMSIGEMLPYEPTGGFQFWSSTTVNF